MTTGAQPSAELVERACANVWGPNWPNVPNFIDKREQIREALDIAAPAIHAAGVQEGRAAMLCEVVALVRDPQRTWIVGRAERDLVADVIEDALGRFSSEGTT